jgi:hypothetical protein
MGDPKVNIRVSAETAQAKKALAEVKSALGEMKSYAVGALGAFGLGLGVRELLEIADNASKAQREMVSLNAVMKNAGYPAEAAASLEATREELSAITIASKDALVTVQKLLIGLKVPYNYIEPFTKLALDLAAFENITPEDAAAKLGRAISSASSELRGYGVQIDDTLPKAQKLDQLLTQLRGRFDGLAQSSYRAGAYGMEDRKKALEELKDSLGDKINWFTNEATAYWAKFAVSDLKINYQAQKDNFLKNLNNQLKFGNSVTGWSFTKEQYDFYLDALKRNEETYSKTGSITTLVDRMRSLQKKFITEANPYFFLPQPKEEAAMSSALSANELKALTESEYDLQKITLELSKVKTEMLKDDLTAEEYAKRRKEIASAELEITKEMLQNKMEYLMEDRDKVLKSELEPAQKRNELEKIHAQLIDLSSKEREAEIQHAIEGLNIDKERLETERERKTEEAEIAKNVRQVRAEIEAQNLKNSWKGGVQDFWNWTNTVQLQSTIVASALTGVVGNAISGISDGIMGLIDGTKSWGQSMVAMGRLILQTLIQVAVQMMVVGAIRTAFGASFFGFMGFAEGGLIPGSPSLTDNRLAAVATGEYVVQSKAVKHYGADYLEALNQMRLPKIGYGIPPSMPTSSFATGGLVGSSVNVSPAPVNVVVLKDQRELKQYLESTEGRKVLYSMVNGMKLDLGVRS